MLNKKLCLLCYKNHAFQPDSFDEMEYKTMENPPSLEYRFNKYWKRFTCPCFATLSGLIILQNPPDNCPYLLEHTVTKPSIFRRAIVRYLFAWHEQPFFLVFWSLALLLLISSFCHAIYGLVLYLLAVK